VDEEEEVEVVEAEEEVEVEVEVAKKGKAFATLVFQTLIFLVILLMAGRKTQWSCVRLISISQRRESSKPGKQLDFCQ